MIEDNTIEGITKLMRGPAIAAFAVKMPLLVQIMKRPVKTEEDKLIRAAVSYIVVELHLAGAKDEDSSAGVAGSPDDSGSGA